MTVVLTLTKGGPGSGHRGHRGRPGKRGGSLPSTGSRLADGVPVPEVSIDRLREMHKNWSDEQVQRYAEQVQRDYDNRDWSKIVVSKGPESYKNKIRIGRDKVKSVHDEIPGFEVRYVRQDALDTITGGGNGGTLGAYAGRRIYIGPRAKSETYVHEYGHFIDNMLGTKINGRGSYHSIASTAFPANVPDWLKKEGFAEFYSTWISYGANKTKTHNILSNIGGSFWKGDKGLAIVNNLDNELRSHLNMK